MHNLREIFSNEGFGNAQEALSRRGGILTEADREVYYRLRALGQSEVDLNAVKNKIADSFRSADGQTREDLRARSAAAKFALGDIVVERGGIEPGFTERMWSLPNISADHVPAGDTDADNVVISQHGVDCIGATQVVVPDHLAIGSELGILDSTAAAALSGARFSVLRGQGAKLKRGLTSFLLDNATERGYQEVDVPLLLTEKTMRGTGQLPKFEDDMFTTKGNNGNVLYLAPTTEVALANLLRGHMFTSDELPTKLTGASENFRREAGKAGKDTKGLIRNHQFPKVELVRIAHPDTSWDDYYQMIDEARAPLDALGLPYQTVELCDGDLGISAHSTRDLEVWLPSQQRFLEVSSVSNTGEFQARRMGMKFKEEDGTKRYVHTLNGTAVAIGRTIACLLENGFNPADGSVAIPEALQDYVGFDTLTKR